jgi:hypothetical protein
MLLFSDEVYANSIFASSDFPSPPTFTSVLTLDVEKYIEPSLVHCLYGMSKVSRRRSNPLGSVTYHHSRVGLLFQRH